MRSIRIVPFAFVLGLATACGGSESGSDDDDARQLKDKASVAMVIQSVGAETQCWKSQMAVKGQSMAVETEGTVVAVSVAMLAVQFVDVVGCGQPATDRDGGHQQFTQFVRGDADREGGGSGDQRGTGNQDQLMVAAVTVMMPLSVTVRGKD